MVDKFIKKVYAYGYMGIRLQIVSILILFASCVETNLDNYFGVDLKTKEWNHEYGMPLIYLKDTFYPVTGESLPKFVLYENRQLIYGKIENNEMIYYEIVLSDIEMKNIFKELGIPRNNFSEKNHIDIIYRGEPPETVLIINKHYKKIITMSGSISLMDEEQTKEHEELVKIYNNIINYNNPNAERWMPDYIEQLMTDWANEYSTSIYLRKNDFGKYEGHDYINEWPSSFPDMFSRNTININGYDYVFLIKNELYSDFFKYKIENFSDNEWEKIIIINGKELWLYNPYYIPLPNIKYWRSD